MSIWGLGYGHRCRIIRLIVSYVLFTLVQMVAVIPSLFKVTLPPGYEEVWDSFSSFEVDWLSVSVPVP